MEPLAEPISRAWPLPFVLQDWEHAPTAVQVYVHSLHDELTQLHEHVEALAALLTSRLSTGCRRGTHPADDVLWLVAGIQQRDHRA
jgi:hypothetical protein